MRHRSAQSVTMDDISHHRYGGKRSSGGSGSSINLARVAESSSSSSSSSTAKKTKSSSAPGGRRSLHRTQSDLKHHISSRIDSPSAAIAAAASAVKPANSVLWVWGENKSGELNLGSKHKNEHVISVPTHSRRIKNQSIIQVEFGNEHAVALTHPGHKVHTCGTWISNVLGTAASSNQHSFKHVADIHLASENQPVVQVASGDSHNVALLASGSVLTWGGRLHGKTGRRYSKKEKKHRKLKSNDPSLSREQRARAKAVEAAKERFRMRSMRVPCIVKHVSCGKWHTVMCTSEGEVFAFGANDHGQLGIPDKHEQVDPTKVTFPPTRSGRRAVKIIKVAAGDEHTLAIADDQQCFAWGKGDRGQLGMGDTKDRHEPTLIPYVNREYVYRNQNAFGPSTPAHMRRVGVCVSASCGGQFSLVLTETGEIYSFGYGDLGQLGHGTRENEFVPKLIHFPHAGDDDNDSSSKHHDGFDVQPMIQIAAGWQHALCLSKDNKVYVWGSNSKGQLGLGDTRNRLEPTLVKAFLTKKQRVEQIGAGGNHSLAFNTPFKDPTEMIRILKRSAQVKAQAATQMQRIKEARSRTSSNASITSAPDSNNDSSSNLDVGGNDGDPKQQRRPRAPSTGSLRRKPAKPKHSSMPSVDLMQDHAAAGHDDDVVPTESDEDSDEQASRRYDDAVRNDDDDDDYDDDDKDRGHNDPRTFDLGPADRPDRVHRVDEGAFRRGQRPRRRDFDDEFDNNSINNNDNINNNGSDDVEVKFQDRDPQGVDMDPLDQQVRVYRAGSDAFRNNPRRRKKRFDDDDDPNVVVLRDDRGGDDNRMGDNDDGGGDVDDDDLSLMVDAAERATQQRLHAQKQQDQIRLREQDMDARKERMYRAELLSPNARSSLAEDGNVHQDEKEEEEEEDVEVQTTRRTVKQVRQPVRPIQQQEQSSQRAGRRRRRSKHHQEPFVTSTVGGGDDIAVANSPDRRAQPTRVIQQHVPHHALARDSSMVEAEVGFDDDDADENDAKINNNNDQNNNGNKRSRLKEPPVAVLSQSFTAVDAMDRSLYLPADHDAVIVHNHKEAEQHQREMDDPTLEHAEDFYSSACQFTHRFITCFASVSETDMRRVVDVYVAEAKRRDPSLVHSHYTVTKGFYQPKHIEDQVSFTTHMPDDTLNITVASTLDTTIDDHGGAAGMQYQNRLSLMLVVQSANPWPQWRETFTKLTSSWHGKMIAPSFRELKPAGGLLNESSISNSSSSSSRRRGGSGSFSTHHRIRVQTSGAAVSSSSSALLTAGGQPVPSPVSAGSSRSPFNMV